MRRIFYATILLIFTSLPVMADPSGSIYSRETRAEAQEALSYYGFDAGAADGTFGPRTRAAISAYQASIGGQPTGEFSRAVLGNLLEQYREVRRNDVATAGEDGLPDPVTSATIEMVQDCSLTSEDVVTRPGFLQEADLNNDGILDYLLDGSAAGCSMICGASNCQVTLLVSTSSGYRRNDFLGYGVAPQTFNCLSNGMCEFAR